MSADCLIYYIKISVSCSHSTEKRISVRTPKDVRQDVIGPSPFFPHFDIEEIVVLSLSEGVHKKVVYVSPFSFSLDHFTLDSLFLP